MVLSELVPYCAASDHLLTNVFHFHDLFLWHHCPVWGWVGVTTKDCGIPWVAVAFFPTEALPAWSRCRDRGASPGARILRSAYSPYLGPSPDSPDAHTWTEHLVVAEIYSIETANLLLSANFEA